MFTAKVGKSVAITAVCTLPKIEIRGVAMGGETQNLKLHEIEQLQKRQLSYIKKFIHT